MSEQNKEPISITEETLDKYFSLEAPPFPGFVTLHILKPIRLRAYKQTIEEGLYFIERSKFESEEQPDIPIFRMDIVKTPHEEIKKIIDNGGAEVTTNQDGTEVVKISQTAIEEAGSPLKIGVQFTPLEVRDEKTLTLLEAFVWAAIDEAEEAGDKEKAHLIFDTAFRKIKKSDSEPTLSSMNTGNEESHGGDTVSAMKEQTDIQAESGLSDSEPTLFGMDTSKNIPIQGTIKPRTQIDPNSKLAQTITMLELGKTISLDVSGGNEKPKSVLTDITLTYEGEGIKLSKQLSEFDREIHNTVATLIHAGNMAFTPRQVWHTLTGSENPPSKAQLSRIEESLDKQRFIRAYVDFSAEARGRNLTLDGEPVESYVIDTYLLNLDKGTIQTANGRKVEGYTVNKLPVLYQHSAALGQVITYPMRMLKASGNTVQNTEENIIIRKYLLRRIGMAKGKRKISPRIKYSSVYEKVGIKNPNKKQRKRINDTVLQILETLKKEKHIKGYEEYKEGRTRAGVDLIL